MSKKEELGNNSNVNLKIVFVIQKLPMINFK